MMNNKRFHNKGHAGILGLKAALIENAYQPYVILANFDRKLSSNQKFNCYFVYSCFCVNYCRSLERKYLDERLGIFLGIPGIFQEVEYVRPQVGWPAPIRTWESH